MPRNIFFDFFSTKTNNTLYINSLIENSTQNKIRQNVIRLRFFNVILSVLFVLLIPPLSIFAQNYQVRLKLIPDNERIEQAKFYEKSLEEIKVELILYSFDEGVSKFGSSYIASFNPSNQIWTIEAPAGLYMLRTHHIGFIDYRETLELDADMEIERPLSANQLPYCYHNGSKFEYIKGSMEFSETIWVQFKSGSTEENLAFLQEFPHENVQKLRFVNQFLITCNIQSQETIAEILLRQTMNDPVYSEGYFIGDQITRIIEKIMANPNVQFANPSYIYPSQLIQKVSKKDFSTLASLQKEIKERREELPKQYILEEFEKTEELKLKLLKAAEGL